MARQVINLGTTANDGTGDSGRVGGDKINDNFEELYTGQAFQTKIGFYIDFSQASLDGLGMSGIVPSAHGGIGDTAITVDGSGDYVVSGGYAKPNSTLSYIQFDAGSTIKALVCEFVPQATGTQLTVSFGAQPSLAVQLLHVSIGDTSIAAQTRFTGDSAEFLQLSGSNGLYAKPLNTAGSTLYRIAFIHNGAQLTIIGPNGEAWTAASDVIAYCAGSKAFFESTGGANASWIRRFWSVVESSAVIPSGLLSPLDLPSEGFPPAVRARVAGGTGAQQSSSFNNATSPYPTLTLGPFGTYSLYAKVLATANSGATSFQCDQPLPNGDYVFDLASPSLQEVVTVSGRSGSSSPYTITCSALANTHTYAATGRPIVVVNETDLGQDAHGSWAYDTSWNQHVFNRRVCSAVGFGSTQHDEYSTRLIAASAGVWTTSNGSGGVCHFRADGGFRVVEGSNRWMGVATLVAGTVTVSNTSVTANSRIFLTSQADGGTPGFLRVSSRSAGTSFTITSSSGSDTSTVAWEIMEPG